MSSTSTDALRLPEIRISDLNILPSLRASYMFANTRFVWVEINNIGVMNTLLQRSAPSGIWYFPNKWYFSTGISIPIPSTMQIALCGRWYCYLVFVSGISECYGIERCPAKNAASDTPRASRLTASAARARAGATAGAPPV